MTADYDIFDQLYHRCELVLKAIRHIQTMEREERMGGLVRPPVCPMGCSLEDFLKAQQERVNHRDAVRPCPRCRRWPEVRRVQDDWVCECSGSSAHWPTNSGPCPTRRKSITTWLERNRILETVGELRKREYPEAVAGEAREAPPLNLACWHTGGPLGGVVASCERCREEALYGRATLRILEREPLFKRGKDGPI